MSGHHETSQTTARLIHWRRFLKVRERKKNHFKASTSPLCLSHPLSPSSLRMLFHVPWLLHFSLYDYIYHSRPFITCLHAVFYSSRQNMITTIKNMSCSLKLLQIDEPVNRINYILKKTTTFKIRTFQKRKSILCNYSISFTASTVYPNEMFPFL